MLTAKCAGLALSHHTKLERAKLEMTKLGLITSSSYQRLLFTSATKKDVFTPRRQISSTSSVWKKEQSPPPNASQSETEHKDSKDEPVKSYDFSKGEITNKTSAGSSGPRNLDEAKSLLQKQFQLTRNQIEEKSDLVRKQLDEKIESVKVIFGATPSKPRTPDEEWYYKRVSLQSQI